LCPIRASCSSCSNGTLCPISTGRPRLASYASFWCSGSEKSCKQGFILGYKTKTHFIIIS
jgi:hypothetical protein